MSWSEPPVSPARRLLLRAALVASAGLLSGCFRPMLAETAPARTLVGRFDLPEIDGRFGYHLYRSLESRLGTPADPLWRLEIETRIDEDDLAITPDNAITRKSLTARADFALVPLAGGSPVLKDTVISQSGYNSTASLYATRTVRRDTEERLARDLGERIARRVLAKAAGLAPA